MHCPGRIPPVESVTASTGGLSANPCNACNVITASMASAGTPGPTPTSRKQANIHQETNQETRGCGVDRWASPQGGQRFALLAAVADSRLAGRVRDQRPLCGPFLRRSRARAFVLLTRRLSYAGWPRRSGRVLGDMRAQCLGNGRAVRNVNHALSQRLVRLGVSAWFLAVANRIRQPSFRAMTGGRR